MEKSGKHTKIMRLSEMFIIILLIRDAKGRLFFLHDNAKKFLQPNECLK